MILSKVFTICYALIFSVSLLTSNTEAYFSQNNSVDATISTAEDWWDQSNLMFIGKDSEVIHICPPTEIAVEIKNTGQSMTKETTYEVLYSGQHEAPDKSGKEITTGSVPILNQGESTILTFQVEQEGWYIFKAYQREGYQDNYEEREIIWSKRISVHCEEEKSTEDEIATESVKQKEETEDKESDKDSNEELSTKTTEPNHDAKRDDEVETEEELEKEETHVDGKKHKQEEHDRAEHDNSEVAETEMDGEDN